MWVIENFSHDHIYLMYLTRGGSMYINVEYEVKLLEKLVNLLDEPIVSQDHLLFEKNGITVILPLR